MLIAKKNKQMKKHTQKNPNKKRTETYYQDNSQTFLGIVSFSDFNPSLLILYDAFFYA